MKARIALEDGRVFEGSSFGATGERSGEVVFNTSMAGYQEILTDPSYRGQIVTMTYPLIGNYGINPEDVESRKPFLEGFVVKECSCIASNWRSQKSLGEYLKENNIMGIEGIDTRALTRHIRLEGVMKAVVCTEDLDDKSLVKKAKSSRGLIGRDMVKEVTCDQSYVWGSQIPDAPLVGAPGNQIPDTRSLRAEVAAPKAFGARDRKQQTGVAAGFSLRKIDRFKVVVLDCGVKFNILRELAGNGCFKYLAVASTTIQTSRAYPGTGHSIT